MAAMNITQNEILEAILSHIGKPNYEGEDAVTTEQLADVLNVSDTTVRRHVKRLLKEGRVEVVFIQTIGITGQRCRVPAYRVKLKAG